MLLGLAATGPEEPYHGDQREDRDGYDDADDDANGRRGLIGATSSASGRGATSAAGGRGIFLDRASSIASTRKR